MPQASWGRGLFRPAGQRILPTESQVSPALPLSKLVGAVILTANAPEQRFRVSPSRSSAG